MATSSKKTVKAAPAKKPAAAKKSAAGAKAATAKKPAAAPKDPPAEAPAPKDPEKKPAAPVAAKAPANRKAPVIVKPAQKPVVEIDNSQAVAQAMSIAQEMKRSAHRDDTRRDDSEIRLSRRPTTRTQGETSVKFPETDLKMFRKRLIEARDKAMSGVNAMKATGFNESEDHEVDGGDGTNQTLRLQALGQMGAINRTIQKIEEALHRIDDGSYGVCTVCGQLIRKPRLMNQPFVLTCMECQNEMERNRS